jgi:hypothetical protein
MEQCGIFMARTLCSIGINISGPQPLWFIGYELIGNHLFLSSSLTMLPYMQRLDGWSFHKFRALWVHNLSSHSSMVSFSSSSLFGFPSISSVVLFYLIILSPLNYFFYSLIIYMVGILVDGLVFMSLRTSGFYVIWVGGGLVSIVGLSTLRNTFVVTFRCWFLIHKDMDYSKSRETHRTLKRHKSTLVDLQGKLED